MKSRAVGDAALRPAGPVTASSGARISASETAFVLWVIAAVLVVTSLPYLLAYLSSPPDRQFMGLMLDVPDHGQYLSWWREFQGSFLIRNKLTPEPNRPIFFNLLWWTLAQVSRWSGLGYAPVYQIFRWIAGGAFLWAAYRLIAQFVAEMHQRRASFLLVTFSSGLGWVLIVLKYTLTGGELIFPLDVYIPEGNSFLCILGYPHFAFAAAFIALIFEFTWRGWRERRVRHTAIAGVLALLLAWQHAYDLLIVYGVIGAFTFLVGLKQRAVPWRLLWGWVAIVLFSCSGAIYSVILTRADPLWREVLAQFANAGVYTPSPLHMVVLFGFPLIAALMTVMGSVWKKQWSAENLFVTGWFLAGAALSYIPADFQIHMLNSWQIPMMILATKGLYEFAVPALAAWRPTMGQRAARWIAIALIIAVLPTNFYLWAWRFVDLARHDYPFYLHRDDIAALNWLRDNSSPDDVVLCSLTLGQYVPAISGNTAFLAHWAQTVDFYGKRERVTRFYGNVSSDEERAETVRTFGIDYVLHGRAERTLGEYDPGDTPWLTLTFSLPHADVYAVRPERLPVVIGSEGTYD